MNLIQKNANICVEVSQKLFQNDAYTIPQEKGSSAVLGILNYAKKKKSSTAYWHSMESSEIKA